MRSIASGCSLQAALTPASPAPLHKLHERGAGGASGACRCWARVHYLIRQPSSNSANVACLVMGWVEMLLPNGVRFVLLRV